MGINDKDISNRALARIFSVDAIIGVVLVTSAATGVYMTLSSQIAIAGGRIDKLESQQKELVTHVQQIKTDTAVLRAEQKNNKQRLDEILKLLLKAKEK